MRFTEAMYYAFKIKQKYPSFKLCGSVALILSGKLPVRDVHDIDFVTHEKDFNIAKAIKSSTYAPFENEKDGYKSYFIKDDDTFDFNLLVYKDDIPIKTRRVKLEIDVQCEDEIIKWKRKYKRSKDKTDLKAMGLKIRG